eukprot:11056857-Ditylum_brightwellii.AAC.1
MDWVVESYADNNGVIQRINTQLSYPYDYPSNILDCDWDLIKQIAVTVQSFPRLPIFAHIKGHQDDTQNNEDLNQKSQQNVDADKLAGGYNIAHDQQRIYVPCVHANLAQLQVQGNIITSHYDTEIKCIAIYGPLLEYICDNQQWTQSQVQSADWDTLSISYKHAKHKKRHTTVKKLCHAVLPTA